MHFTGKTQLEIPYDIRISIIDELASQDLYVDLRSISQTCRSLLHPCRVHLFSTIQVDRRAHQFAALLKQNSTIKDYVRNLVYHPYVTDEDIANALLLLGNIQTLTLVDVGEWGSFTPHAQHAIIHLFSSPSLIRVNVTPYGILPIHLLSGCSNLKHLKLHSYPDASSKAHDSSIIPKAPPKLLSLNSTIETVVHDLLNERRSDGLPMLDLSDLQSLTVRISSWQNHSSYLEQILRLTPRLDHLNCTVFNHDGLFQQLAFTPPPTLRSLKIQLAPPLPTRFLELWTSQPNYIDEINIIVHSGWTYISIDQGWQELDRLLADRSSFQNLVKLRITIRSRNYEALSDLGKAEVQASAFKFKSTKLSRLSALAARDHLDFELCVVPI